MFEFDETIDQRARIKVIGVGGAGGNALNRMIEAGLDGVDFIAVNTDAQDLEDCKAKTKIQIGKEFTRGLGTGGDYNIGEQALLANTDGLSMAIGNADMVFITAGMGGGTGTGASPSIAKIAKGKNCLTVGVVTMPFDFEGKTKKEKAKNGLKKLKQNVDNIIVISNQRLLHVVDWNTGLKEAFRIADSILYSAIKGISDLIVNHGIINIDFADVRNIMQHKGNAIIGTGVATGEERAVLAAQQAISSPLLNDKSIKGASGILINITVGKDLKIVEIEDACKIIYSELGTNAEIIIGIVEDVKLENEFMITVIATGIDSTNIDNCEIEKETIEEYISKESISNYPLEFSREKQSSLFGIENINNKIKIDFVIENVNSNSNINSLRGNNKQIESQDNYQVGDQLQLPSIIRNQIGSNHKFQGYVGENFNSNEIGKYKNQDIMTSNQKQVDLVECSVFSLPEIITGQSFIVQVFFHTSKQSEEAKMLAFMSNEKFERRTITKLKSKIYQEELLLLHLQIPGLISNKDVQKVLWNGDVISVVFGVEIPKNHPSNNIQGILTVSS